VHFIKAIASIHQHCEFYDDIHRGPKHPVFYNLGGFKSAGLFDGQSVSKPHQITNGIVVNDVVTLPCLFLFLFFPKEGWSAIFSKTLNI